MLLLLVTSAAFDAYDQAARRARRADWKAWGDVKPAGAALLRRVGRGRLWLPIPPRTLLEGLLHLRPRNYTGLPPEARLLPPEDFEALTRRPFSPQHRPVACMVRDPQLRVAQELDRRCRESRRCDRGTELRRMGARAEAVLHSPRAPLALDHELLHMLPQVRYVYARDGRPQCHCALSYDNVARVAGHRQLPPVLRRGDTSWPASLARLYADDARLHRNVSGALRWSPPSACFRVTRSTQHRLRA